MSSHSLADRRDERSRRKKGSDEPIYLRVPLRAVMRDLEASVRESNLVGPRTGGRADA